MSYKQNNADTVVTLEPFEPGLLVYKIGSFGRLAELGDSLGATHVATRHYPVDVSASVTPLHFNGTYVGVLSASCLRNQTLFQDVDGTVSPSAQGPQVGRACTAGEAGDEIEFIYEPATGGGGAGARVTSVTLAAITSVPAETDIPLDGSASVVVIDGAADFSAFANQEEFARSGLTQVYVNGIVCDKDQGAKILSHNFATRWDINTLRLKQPLVTGDVIRVVVTA